MIRWELLRLRRSRRPLVAALALALFVALMLLGFYTYAQTRTRGEVEFRYTFENPSYFNGLVFALYAFYFGFLLLLPVFAAVEGSAQIAGDTSSGTLQLLLARPVSRARLFFGKLAVAAGFCTLLAAGFLVLDLVVGLAIVGWGDLTLYPGVLQMTDRRQRLEQADALVRFALAWPAASLALMAPLSLSFWIASHARGAVEAVGGATALYLLLYVISQVHFFDDLQPWLFTSSMAYWRGLFREEVEWRSMAEHAARLVGFSALFLAAAFHRFRRREEV